MDKRILWAGLVLAPLGVGAAMAADRAAPMADAVVRLIACRGIGEDGARLACYDREVAAFAAAIDSGELLVADRAKVRKARRSLFGLTLPEFDLFSRGDDKADGAKDDDSRDDAEAFTQIETTIKAASTNAAGRWQFTLEDGARWIQVDDAQLSNDPRPGGTIRIRKAAMGSYFANVGKQRAIRVRRVN